MIKNIVFDFGDVFINLDKQATISELYTLGVREISEEMFEVTKLYVVGGLSTPEFITKFMDMFPAIKEDDFINAWNAILKDFPLHRLEFLKSLSKYK